MFPQQHQNLSLQPCMVTNRRSLVLSPWTLTWLGEQLRQGNRINSSAWCMEQSVLATTTRSPGPQPSGWLASSRMLLLDNMSMEMEACGRTTGGDRESQSSQNAHSHRPTHSHTPTPYRNTSLHWSSLVYRVFSQQKVLRKPLQRDIQESSLLDARASTTGSFECQHYTCGLLVVSFRSRCPVDRTVTTCQNCTS